MHPPRPPQTEKPKPKPFVFHQKEPSNLFVKILPWLFVAMGISFIAMMIATNEPQKPLVCDRTLGSHPSLTQFGTCH